jgi:hypothetical protein
MFVRRLVAAMPQPTAERTDFYSHLHPGMNAGAIIACGEERT